MTVTMSTRNKIFVSYSHKDKKLFEEFKIMLAPAIQNGRVDLWDDQKIPPGAKWKEEIQKALASASVAVLLVSQNFLASRFIADKELPPLLKAAREEGVTIFWIYLSSCLFEQTEIESYQAAYDISRPLDRLTKSQRQAALSEACAKLITAALLEPTKANPPSANVVGAAATGLEKEQQRTPGDSILKLHPDFERLMPAWEREDTKKVLKELREILITQLHKVAASSKCDISQLPPMNALRKIADCKVLTHQALKHLEYAISISSKALYDWDVSKQETEVALQEAAAGLHMIMEEYPNACRFLLKRTADDRFYFIFAVGERKLIMSEYYMQKNSAINGIWSVKANIKCGGRIEGFVAKDGKLYFRIFAANRQALGASGPFDSEEARDEAINMLEACAQDAPVLEV